MATACVAPVILPARAAGFTANTAKRAAVRARPLAARSSAFARVGRVASTTPVVARRAARLVVRSEEVKTEEVKAVKVAAPKKVDQGPLAEEAEAFSAAKFPLGVILLGVGLSLLTYGFGAFFQFLPGQDLSAVMLIYGFPISLIGAALQYAKLDPVPMTTYKAALALREEGATKIQIQVREDTTRYRYGDEQHLDEALKRIFRIGQAGGIGRKFVPVLKGLREEVTDGKYTLVMIFDDTCPFEDFESRQGKIQGFFGPGVLAPLTQIDSGVEVALISTGEKFEASEEEAEYELLPPLQPGMPPRRVLKGSVPKGWGQGGTQGKDKDSIFKL
eukprot:CAMPEP_0198209856 /NCGR_PEP_ID=MMETSP1445-20131203/17776_1 /TAXON_ID=36898 /ORGANISM="Pyramimonas sp., Strain CCMP2087" /LENGTH=331 /DNA_ID=CAMNT_0043883759 /DNA_START=66 /DNA_END=1061 /DNA_ORIENTATION=+